MKGKAILSKFLIIQDVIRWYSMAFRTRVGPCLQIGSASDRAIGSIYFVGTWHTFTSLLV